MGRNDKNKNAARSYSASPERWPGPTSSPESDIIIIPSDSSDSNAEEDELPVVAKKMAPRKRKLDERVDTSPTTPAKPRPRPRPGLGLNVLI